MLLCDVLQILDNFETGSRVQTAGRFIEEKNLWSGDQKTGDTQPTLLTTTDALSDRSTDNKVGLVTKTERGKEFIDPSRSLLARHGTVMIQLKNNYKLDYDRLFLPW